MEYTKLQIDIDFENTFLFGHYLMVVTDEKISVGDY